MPSHLHQQRFQPVPAQNKAISVRQAGLERRRQELALREAELAAARLQAQEERAAIAQRVHGGALRDDRSDSHDVSAMSTGEDNETVEYLDLAPLEIVEEQEGAQHVLAKKAERQRLAQEEHLRLLREAREQNAEDKRKLAVRMAVVN